MQRQARFEYGAKLHYSLGIMQQHIFLIGGRASGKTSLARVLADKLGTTWVDTDGLLQERVGESISSLVGREGWDMFRDQETETLRSVCTMPPMIVACGGGMVLRAQNRELLKSGMVFYLKADPSVLAERLAADPNEPQRPSLTGKSIDQEMREVMAEREPLYLSCADCVLDSSKPLDELAAEALSLALAARA